MPKTEQQRVEDRRLQVHVPRSGVVQHAKRPLQEHQLLLPVAARRLDAERGGTPPNGGQMAAAVIADLKQIQMVFDPRNGLRIALKP